MRDSAGGSIREWATAIGVSRSSVERKLNRLAEAKAGKLVTNTLGRWTLTAAGLRAIEADK
jgi:hypothetical protein